MAAESLVPELCVVDSLSAAGYDGVLVISGGSSPDTLEGKLRAVGAAIYQQQQLDASASEEGFVVSCADVAGNRLVVSPTGPTDGDFDDVRTFYTAGEKGIKKALRAGVKRPIVVVTGGQRFPHAVKAACLGVLHVLYTPLEVREAFPERGHKVAALGVFVAEGDDSVGLLFLLRALEAGRTVCRDVMGSDPERMAPPRVAEYVTQMFEGTCVKVSVVSDEAVFEKEYPLLAAVNRCAKHVTRHAGRLIWLEYTPPTVSETLMLVGKGITYDTGGADLKAGGIMAGMSRDKGGAAFVAGFFQLLSQYQPAGLKVVGAMCMVRNSIGSDCYVSDEIITSRAGVRVRVGNTDAEGRMVMADVLAHMKEKALSEVNPQLYTVATLTGHVIRCYGTKYSAAIDNGPAWAAGVSRSLGEVGDLVADPVEISRLRREDFEFVAPPSEYEDVLQANNLPSSATARGHQYPAAFMMIASGLDKHGASSSRPLKYTHLDIAGSAGGLPHMPTAAPLLTMAHRYVLNKAAAATK